MLTVFMWSFTRTLHIYIWRLLSQATVQILFKSCIPGQCCKQEVLEDKCELAIFFYFLIRLLNRTEPKCGTCKNSLDGKDFGILKY